MHSPSDDSRPAPGRNPRLLTHYFTFYQSMGGVQSMLQRHHALDPNWGLESNIVAFFDAPASPTPRVRGLGFSGATWVAQARQRFGHLPPAAKQPVAIYHNGWGLPFFADLDQAERRIAILHSDWPGLAKSLPSLDGLVDGMLCVSHPLLELVRKSLPSLGPDRRALLPYPIAACPVVSRRRSPGEGPFVLGFNARLSKEQKRVDRLPALLEACDATGLDYRFELLGEGSQQNWLRGRLAGNPRVVFHGRRGGEAYWETLAGWDALVFTSDYEGLPIALLEAMSAGVVPIYPRIGSGGDSYAAGVRSDFLYEPGDHATVARLLRELAGLPTDAMEALRARARQLAAPHAGNAYHEVFTSMVERISGQPRISASRFAPRSWHWQDYCPFGVLSRLFPGAYTRCAPRLG